MRTSLLLVLAFAFSAIPPDALPAQEPGHGADAQHQVVGHDETAAPDDSPDADLDCVEGDGHRLCFAEHLHRVHRGPRGYLGVQLTSMTPELREHMGAPRTSGVLVSRVEEGSPAREAGIEVGDVIVSIDGEPVATAGQIAHAIAERKSGELATLELYRAERLEQVTATLAEREHAPRHRLRLLGDDGRDLESLLGDLDLSELGETVRESLEQVDWNEIRDQVHDTLRDLDVDERAPSP